MASILNLTFSSVFTEKGNVIIPTLLNILQGHYEDKFILIEMHAHEVRKNLLKNATEMLIKKKKIRIHPVM